MIEALGIAIAPFYLGRDDLAHVAPAHADADLGAPTAETKGACRGFARGDAGAASREVAENDPSSIVARIFCGNLGSGILFLNVRAILPGSADLATRGVDIEVCDECRDVELALIGRLAQANVGEGRVNVRRQEVKEKVADLA